MQGDRLLRESAGIALAPGRMSALSAPVTQADAVTFRLLSSAGAVLLEHTEGKLDAALPGEYQLGTQPQPSWLTQPASESDYLARSDYNERFANYDFAINDYTLGLKAFVDSQLLSKGFGRLLQMLANPGALAALGRATVDPETQYYRALAASDTSSLPGLQSHPVYGPASSVRLAELRAGAGDNEAALAAIRTGLDVSPRSIRAGAIEVALLRSLGLWDQASGRLAYWTAIDPTDSALRYELYRLGQDDEGLWLHLGSDAERVLNVAEHLMRLGQFEDALEILEWDFDAVTPLRTEPGIPAPSVHALIWYYRGYCREKAGRSGANEYRTAAGFPLTFLFPNRTLTLDVADAALRFAADDASAHWLRGCVLLSMRRTDEAIAAFERVRQLRPSTPSLHRTLGRTWLDVKGDKAKALPILEEGTRYEPDNLDLWNALGRAR